MSFIYPERYQATVSVSGIWASPQNVTLIFSKSGNSVNMFLEGVHTTANTSAVITAPVGTIPARFLGSVFSWGDFLRQTFYIRDNGVDKAGVINIYADGHFQISAGDATGTVFAGSGDSGFPPQGIPWCT